MRLSPPILVIASLSIYLASVVGENPKYSVIAKYKIGGEGGWDYLSVDHDSHRLFISRSTHVMVMDTETGVLVGDIPNTPGVHGIALANKLNKGFTSNGRDNSVTVFDLKSLKELARVKVGTNPDAIVYEPQSNRVFTMNGRSSDATVIDAKTDVVIGTIKLDGKPEFVVSDGKGFMYVNIEDKNEIQQFDINKLVVTKSWSIAPGDGPSGLAIDSKRHKLFSVCGNNMMVVSDYVAGKVIATPKIGSGPDAACYDPKMNLAFSSNGGDGTVTIVDGDNKPVTDISSQQSARTMILDPVTHKLFLIAAEYSAPVAGSRRGTVVPGSASIIVIGPSK